MEFNAFDLIWKWRALTLLHHTWLSNQLKQDLCVLCSCNLTVGLIRVEEIVEEVEAEVEVRFETTAEVEVEFEAEVEVIREVGE